MACIMKYGQSNAPCSIKFNKHILGIIIHNLIELFIDEREHALILTLRNRLALELRKKLPSEVLADHSRHSLSLYRLALVIRVLELILQVLNNETRPFGFSKVQSLCMVAELGRIYPNKVDLAAVLGSNRLENSERLVFLFVCGVQKQVCDGFTAAGVHGIRFSVHLTKDRDSQLLNPCFEFGGGNCRWRVRVLGDVFIKVAVDDDSGRSDTCGCDSCSVRGDTKEVLVTELFCCCAKFRCGGLCGGGDVGEDNELIGVLEFSEVRGGDVRNGREVLSEGDVNRYEKVIRRVEYT